MTVRVSVVVPTYKRPQLLERCLNALLAQDFDPRAYEIIVVDDAASDETRCLVERQAAKRTGAGPALRYLAAHDTQGPAAARNLGWRAARGSVIAFTDDDCIPDHSWLRAGTAPFRQNGHMGVSGRVIVPLPAEPTDYELNESYMEDSIFLTANCFYRRDALDAAQGFDERFTSAWREDSDLLFTLLEQYAQPEHFVQVPDAVVYHPPRKARWGASLQLQRKSMFNALLYKKHPRYYRQLIQPSPPWHYYGIVGSLLAAILLRLAGRRITACLSTALWLILTLRFCKQRLAHTSQAPLHVIEMLVTSVLIPPLSLFWRLLGALRFRVMFL